VLQQRLWKK